MMVKSFLTWMDRAGPVERAQAVDMLARAFLSRALGGDTPEEVEAALTSILDDPAPSVRRSLALAFADRKDAPHHIVMALASDLPQVGAILIARSPQLAEPDLVELAFAVEGMSLAAIAMRPEVSARVARIIVKRDIYDAALALARNAEAHVDEVDCAHLAEHFGDRHDMREALLARSGLPAVARYILVSSLTKRLGNFARDGGFLAGQRGNRMIDDTLQGALLTIGEKHLAELPGLVRHLRLNAELTPSLLLRSVLGGDLSLLIAALSELTGLELSRIGQLMHARTDAALAALCRRAELPGFLVRPLIAAIRATGEAREPKLSGFSLPVIRAAQSACIDVPGEEGVRLLALLRRYEAEAARLDSRRLAEDLRLRAREEFVHFTLRADQLRQLEELDTEERLGSVRDYEEIAFEPGQIAEPLEIREEPGLAGIDARMVVIEEAALAAEPHIPAPDHWSDLAAATLAHENMAPKPAEPIEADGWLLRLDGLSDSEPEVAATMAAPITNASAKKQNETPAKTPDLRTLIAEWRREREERDRALGVASAPAAIRGAADNEDGLSDKPVVHPRTTFGLRVA